MARPLREALRRFIRYKRRLGCAYATVDHALRPLDRWLERQRVRTPSDVTPTHLEEWVAVRSGQITRATLARELSWLRLLYRFLSSRGEVPRDPTSALPVVRSPQYVPFVFSVDQVRALLSSGPTAFRMPQTRTLYYTLFHLLYAAGLRVSEALRLRVEDVDLDLDRRILHVRKTKFYKTRLVPLGRKACENLRTYLQLRRQRTPALQASDHVFVPTRRLAGRVRLTWASVRNAFRAMLRRIGVERVREERGSVRGQARIHSLRHSFAVHRLLKWYREVADVNQKLLFLSTYMGHSDVAHTQVYLTLSDTVLAEAQKRVTAFLSRGGRS